MDEAGCHVLYKLLSSSSGLCDIFPVGKTTDANKGSLNHCPRSNRLAGPCVQLAMAVPPHSREWERAMACLKQGLRNSVSADWWRRVLVLAPQ
jgi:hypothetical protein